MSKKTTLKQCLGIDVSMKKIDCCLSFYTGELKIKVLATSGFDNNPGGFVKLREWLGRKQDNGLPLYVNMEATGTYHEEAAYFLAGVGYRLSIIQPTKGKQYAKSLDEKNKTDKIDAGMLARMGLERELTLWNRPDEQLRLLKRMSRERIGLIRDRNALTNQLHALNHSFEAFGDSVERLKERIALATKQLGEIELQMREMAESDPKLWKRISHAITIPAVNFVTAITVIDETDGFANIGNRRQLVSYVGLDVVMKESGTLTWRPHISKRGNAYIRAGLYMAAVSSIIHNKTLKTYFNRLKDNGKPGKTGIVALERKLLVLIYTLYKNGQDYIPDHR
ncbi:IS110 family transposase [Mucilaginibacter robiniae]|uniref:IS110 family transposase n=1 Tax=Mucilaginibacter robiniae TaxID=2728022 RepID=A0A7L5EBE2_9SPHI|nr:IS110 family transposase [Mucilaginibacter robiniae]QJD97716.1 IS110 family transposase [Mucilaginibacter robiniae]